MASNPAGPGVAIYQPSPSPVIRPKTSILDKSLSRGKQEVSLSAFALLFSETVQYFQSRSSTVSELQSKLHELGFQVGARILDLIFVREKNAKRETKLLNVLLFVKSTLWKTLFGKEADKLGMISHKKSLITIFGYEHFKQKFNHNLNRSLV